MGGKLHAPANLPLEKGPDTLCIRDGMGPSPSLDGCKQTAFTEVRNPNRPSRSDYLNQRRCPSQQNPYQYYQNCSYIPSTSGSKYTTPLRLSTLYPWPETFLCTLHNRKLKALLFTVLRSIARRTLQILNGINNNVNLKIKKIQRALYKSGVGVECTENTEFRHKLFFLKNLKSPWNSRRLNGDMEQLPHWGQNIPYCELQHNMQSPWRPGDRDFCTSGCVPVGTRNLAAKLNKTRRRTCPKT